MSKKSQRKFSRLRNIYSARVLRHLVKAQALQIQGQVDQEYKLGPLPLMEWWGFIPAEYLLLGLRGTSKLRNKQMEKKTFQKMLNK